MSVGERLKAIRDSFGDSQRSMSKRLALGPNVWALYEREGRLPSDDALRALASLGFSIDWLVTGDGAMRAKTHRGRSTEQPGKELDTADIVTKFALSPRHDGPPENVGEAILRQRPRKTVDIPEDIRLSLYSLCVFLEAGRVSYPAALVIARYIVDSIQSELGKDRLPDKEEHMSEPTNISKS